MKKVINTLLVLMMALMQLIPTNSVKADSEKGSITISNALVGKTYTIYKIFDLESYSTSAGAYSYKVAENWKGFIYEKVDGKDQIKTDVAAYIEIVDGGYVVWKSGASVEGFAKLAIEYAKDNKITNDGQKVVPTNGNETTNSIEFEDLDLGYYLVDSNVGTVCGLDTTNPDVEIKEKNSIPTVSKKVDNNGSWSSENNAKIGDVVKYQTTITVAAGAENYVLTDRMSSGLSLDSTTIKVYLNSVSDKTLVKEINNDQTRNYTLTINENGFVLSFTNSFIGEREVNDKIIVEYSATLNSDALVCKAGNCKHNDNETDLTYGDEAEVNKTPISKTETYTYEFKLVKTKTNGDELSGAEFALYDSLTGGNKIMVYKVEGTENTYRVAYTEGELKLADSTVISAGTVMIEGLNSDKTYYLEETKAPDGYNKLTSRVKVELNKKTGSGTTATIELTTVNVVNKTGSELPSTGGVGTVLFISIGTIMILGFGVLLVTKLRLSKMSV